MNAPQNTLAEVQELALQAAADPEAAELFEKRIGVSPQAFSLLPAKDQEKCLLQPTADQAAEPVLKGGPTSEARLLEVISKLITLDEETVRDRIGGILVIRSDDPEHHQAFFGASAGAMAYHYRSLASDDSGPTVFFRDKIPEGIEERVIFREIFQLHSRRVDTTGRALLEESVGRWDSWRVDSPENQIFNAVDSRIEALRKGKRLPSSHLETQFVFAVQEALKRGIQPDVNGKGVSGWLNEVCEHAKYTIRHTTGVDLNEMTPGQLLEMVDFATPFGSEVKKMKAVERDRRFAAEAIQRENESLDGFISVETVHTAEVAWWWSDAALNDIDYKLKVNDAVNGAIQEVERRFESVINNSGYCCQFEGVELRGCDLEDLQEAALEIAATLRQFKEVKPLKPLLEKIRDIDSSGNDLQM
jgi:hypothetical protein